MANEFKITVFSLYIQLDWIWKLLRGHIYASMWGYFHMPEEEDLPPSVPNTEPSVKEKQSWAPAFASRQFAHTLPVPVALSPNLICWFPPTTSQNTYFIFLNSSVRFLVTVMRNITNKVFLFKTTVIKIVQ